MSAVVKLKDTAPRPGTVDMRQDNRIGDPPPLDGWEGLDDEERTRGAWERMVDRCTYYDDPLYRAYGGRGIGVCERWRSFDAFVEDMGLCPPGCSLERDDIDFGYEPLNCRWIPWRKQRDNTRRTRAWSDFWNRRYGASKGR